LDCVYSPGPSFQIFYVWLPVNRWSTHVTIKRISVYLAEKEVTDQVPSLKKDYSEPYLFGDSDDEGLGLECATLKWNKVVELVEKGNQPSHPLRQLFQWKLVRLAWSVTLKVLAILAILVIVSSNFGT
jgi:hypothetical protein